MPTTTFSGQIALICPDCQTHLVNLAPHGERYHCYDCDLKLVREREQFLKMRLGEVVGAIAVDEVGLHMTWRPLGLARAAV